jgi:hypothetical protein
MEAEIGGKRIPKDDLHEAPLIKAARGGKVEVDQLKHAFIGSMDIAISRIGTDNRASDAFRKAKDMVNLSYDPLGD